MDLNRPQLEAVKTLSGPLLVLAGAGTGKTRVVTYRIAELIRHRVRPERILAVTFTNKAAAEMQERSAALLGGRGSRTRQVGQGSQGGRGRQSDPKPEISTFHSLCVRILRRNIQRLGYPAAFGICDRGDQESFARGALREIRVPEAALRPGELLGLIGRWKNSSIRPEQAAAQAQNDKEHLAAAAYRRYQNALKAAGSLDFDDLLLCTEELFAADPEVRRKEAARFDHLLVDEYQDTNGSQYRIVKALAGGHRNLCVVGDDDQSIYGWRGAEVTHILQFQRDWPEAKVVRLEDNYRSTREILGWANRLIAFNTMRHKKVLRATLIGETPRILQFPDEAAEAKAVVEEIQTRITAMKKEPRDFAILFRTNEQPRSFELELRRAKVHYVLVGGMSFYDRREVRDVLAYLKWIVQPSDEVSLLRIINTPPRGIGQSTVAKLTEQAIALGKPLWEVLHRQDVTAAMSPATMRGVAQLTALHGRMRARKDDGRPADLVRQLIADVGYREELARQCEDPNEREARVSAVEEVVNAAAEYQKRSREATLAGFLQELALVANDNDRDKESQLERNAVVLMTLHAAKGLEFPEVYMVGMEEGLLPHRRSVEAGGQSIDEERRLCYVGVTRAKQRLTLSMALSRYKWGKPRPTVPSRFLYEVTGQADNPNYLEVVRGSRPTLSGQHRPAAGKPHAAGGAVPGARKPMPTKKAPAKRPGKPNASR